MFVIWNHSSRNKPAFESKQSHKMLQQRKQNRECDRDQFLHIHLESVVRCFLLAMSEQVLDPVLCRFREYELARVVVVEPPVGWD